MTVEELNLVCRGTLVELLNIQFTLSTPQRVEATMKISPELYQPMGVVHGGALMTLAETVGSAGSFLQVDREQFNVFGASVNSQHIEPAREGYLHAVGLLVVKTDFKHIWDVAIRDQEDKLISISRVTNSIKPRKKEKAPDQEQ